MFKSDSFTRIIFGTRPISPSMKPPPAALKVIIDILIMYRCAVEGPMLLKTWGNQISFPKRTMYWMVEQIEMNNIWQMYELLCDDIVTVRSSINWLPNAGKQCRTSEPALDVHWGIWEDRRARVVDSFFPDKAHFTRDEYQFPYQILRWLPLVTHAAGNSTFKYRVGSGNATSHW